MKRISVATAALIAGTSAALAQAGTSYVVWEGKAFVTDNPTSATCQQNGINFGADYTIIYRGTFAPATYVDAISLGTDRFHSRVASTQSPSNSLNSVIVGGPSNAVWNYINSRAGSGSNVATTTNLTIVRAGGSGGAPLATTLNVIINGTINNFLAESGCTVTIHADLARRPDQ